MESVFYQQRNLFDYCVVAGARYVATLLHEMKRRGKDCCFGVILMCIGTLFPFSVCKWCASASMFIYRGMPLTMNVFNWNVSSGMGVAAVLERGCYWWPLQPWVVQSNILLSKDASIVIIWHYVLLIWHNVLLKIYRD